MTQRHLHRLADTDDLPGVGVIWLTGDEASRVGEPSSRPPRRSLAATEQSEAAFKWFRSDLDDINEHRDGLTLDAQGHAPLMITIATLLPPTSRQRGDQYWLQSTRDVQVPTAAAFGLVTVPDPQPPGHATMNQVTERIEREQQTGIAPTFAGSLAGLVGEHAEQVLTAFRVGSPTTTPHPSRRRGAAAVLR